MTSKPIILEIRDDKRLLIVDTPFVSKRYMRSLTDEQIVTAFLLIELFMPASETASRDAKHKWLTAYVDYLCCYHDFENSPLGLALSGVSSTTLYRFLSLADNAQLQFGEMPVATTFGAYVRTHVDMFLNQFRWVLLSTERFETNPWYFETIGITYADVMQAVGAVSETELMAGEDKPEVVADGYEPKYDPRDEDIMVRALRGICNFWNSFRPRPRYGN